MTIEQLRFAKRVALLTFIILGAGVAAHEALRFSSAHSTGAAEREAGVLLASAESALQAPESELPQRISTAASSAAQADNLLRAATSKWHTRERFASAIRAVIPGLHPLPPPSSSLSAVIASRHTELQWLLKALPSLERLAAYDAASDLSSGDLRDMRVRLYMAREGFRSVLPSLEGSPAALVALDTARLRSEAADVIASATAAIATIEQGRNPESEIRAFIRNASAAARSAKMLTSSIADTLSGKPRQ